MRTKVCAFIIAAATTCCSIHYMVVGPDGRPAITAMG